MFVPSRLPLPAPVSVSALKRRSSRLLVALLAVVLVLPGTGSVHAAGDRPNDRTPAAAPFSVPVSLVAEPVPVDPGTARRFEVALYRAKERFGFHSVELAVLGRNGLAWSGSRGPRPRTQFVIGSVTKTFVAALTLQLAEEGRFRLDDPVSAHLGRFAPGVTIRQLLNHTSGIADLYNPATRSVLSRWPHANLSPVRVLRNVGGRRFAAGRGYAYSNTNYLLLAMLVERVTGNSLEAEIGARFLAPLGMRSTTVLSETVHSPRLSRAWVSAFWGSGNMTSTAADLARWGQALYGTRLHSDGTVRDMLAFGGRPYGLGAQKLRVGGWTFPGHSGLLGRDTTLLVWIPQRQVALAVIVNRASSQVDDLLAYRHGDNPSLLALAMELAR